MLYNNYQIKQKRLDKLIMAFEKSDIRSQSELAKLSGISRQTINGIFTGRVFLPRDETLEILANTIESINKLN